MFSALSSDNERSSRSPSRAAVCGGLQMDGNGARSFTRAGRGARHAADGNCVCVRAPFAFPKCEPRSHAFFLRSIIFAVGLVAALAHSRAADASTFTRDVAPIVFRECAECHHAGGIAPFALTTFAEVKKRAKTIARVIGDRTMPPWPPEPGHGDFVNARRLSEEQIATISRWMKTGMAQGAARDLPPLPAWRDGWQLGEPDLILTPPRAFPLPASGPDIYRNMVLPYVAAADRFVRAIEFRPIGTTAIHHAFVLVDETGDARRLEALESEPGFPGMLAGRGARAPGGFVSWQPGRRPAEVPDGMSWVLRKKADLVLQLHLRPTGKPEAVQPQIGIFFTDRAPVRPYMLLLLRSATIDIPAGEKEYAIEASYPLASDVSVVGLAPHLHYLGKEVRGWAERPDGTREELLFIKQWDFDWQGDYRYAKPIALPKGTTLRMRFTYDNSAQNPANTNHPPQRVQYGLQSSDEMGELWFWLETKTPGELQTLQRDYFTSWGLRDKLAVNEALLRRDPKDAASRTELGAAFSAMGRVDEAIAQLRQAIGDDPKMERAHYALGVLHSKRGEAAEAEAAFARAVEIDPNDAKAQNNLGAMLLSAGKVAKAIEHLEIALRLNPEDAMARESLERARRQGRER